MNRNIKIKAYEREQKIKSYTNILPHKIFRTPQSFNWFNKHFDKNLIKKSLYSLFPNNYEPKLKKEKISSLTILLKWLSHYCEPKNKFKNYYINPKYFFNDETYKNIIKLRDIFLQFDEDGSRKMEIDEIVSMFQQNNVNVNEKELIGLFFKDKKIKEKDIQKLYLDFYQFFQFSLDKKFEKDFELFIRQIKNKIMKQNEIIKQNDIQKLKEKKEKKNNYDRNQINNDDDYKNNLFLYKTTSFNDDESYEKQKNNKEIIDKLFRFHEEYKPVYLPNDFNKILDYFIIKGEERKSHKKIRKTIKKMQNVMNPGTFSEDDPDFKNDEDSIPKINNECKDKKNLKEDTSKNNERSFSTFSSRKSSMSFHNKSKMKRSIDIQKDFEELNKQLKDIKNDEVMKEFYKLFNPQFFEQKSVFKKSSPLDLKDIIKNISFKQPNNFNKRASMPSLFNNCKSKTYSINRKSTIISRKTINNIQKTSSKVVGLNRRSSIQTDFRTFKNNLLNEKKNKNLFLNNLSTLKIGYSNKKITNRIINNDNFPKTVFSYINKQKYNAKEYKLKNFNNNQESSIQVNKYNNNNNESLLSSNINNRDNCYLNISHNNNHNHNHELFFTNLIKKKLEKMDKEKLKIKEYSVRSCSLKDINNLASPRISSCSTDNPLSTYDSRYKLNLNYSGIQKSNKFPEIDKKYRFYSNIQSNNNINNINYQKKLVVTKINNLPKINEKSFLMRKGIHKKNLKSC